MGANAIALLQSAQPAPIEAVLTLLLNELSAISDNEVVLVLDDYHVVDAHDVHNGMAFLLDHLPPRMHLVIASRADPPLPLARLRACEHGARSSRSAPKICALQQTRPAGISMIRWVSI